MDTGTGAGTRTGIEDIEPISISKRKRRDTSIPGDKEDTRNVTPVSMETEDISEEVHQRLMIREERRKKRPSKSEKRKRESFASNESVEHAEESGRPKRKKAKVKSATAGVGQADGQKRAKRRGSDESDFEYARVLKRAKQESGSTAP